MIQRDFFRWQHSVLGWLLGWGTGSMVVGAGLATAQSPDLRQIGLQALGWGAIDAVLALNGRRSARAKHSQSQAGIEQSRTTNQEARQFQRILAINAALDLLYIAGGWRLMQTAPRRSNRHGMGAGILIQGVFLLIYDSLLTWRVTAWLSRR